MSDDREHRIGTRAHQMWEAEGSPESRHDVHWLAAEKEIDGQQSAADPSEHLAESDAADNTSAMSDPGSPGGTSGTGGTTHDQDR